MSKYSIKISGSGTADELIEALRNIANGIEEAKKSESESAVLDGATWEDSVLCTEIKE